MLWSFSILTVFAVSLGFAARQKAAFFNRLEKRQTLWNAAWSGVENARSAVTADPEKEVDSYAEEWARLSSLSDEQAKLNLNTADPAAVSLVLQQATELSSEDADALAYAIVDWRDGDSAYGHPDRGAEDSDYGGLALPYEAKDAPYETPDELLLVKGMNRDIFEKMKPFVTVFGPGTVNVNTARREVLVALGLPMAAADKLILHRDGPDGKPGTADDRPFRSLAAVTSDLEADQPPPSGIERVAIENLVGAEKVDVKTGFFGVTAKAETENGRAELTVEAVLNRECEVLWARSSGFQWRSR